MYHRHWTTILRSVAKKLNGLKDNKTRQVAIDYLVARLNLMKAEIGAGEWPLSFEEEDREK